MLWAVSRAPLAKLQTYKRRMGWTFPWASSHGSDFNFDYSVGFTEEEQQREGGIEYNYRSEDALKPSGPSDRNVWGTGVDLATFLRERRGVSAFVGRARGARSGVVWPEHEMVNEELRPALERDQTEKLSPHQFRTRNLFQSEPRATPAASAGRAEVARRENEVPC
jgi:hypothetical protein